MPAFDAVVVGAGPNGLAAAVAVARAGRSVLVIEGHDTVGGGSRTLELTLPGYRHDVCSAVHPMGIGSPFFKTLPLEEHGLRWVHPDVPLAHPLGPGEAVLLRRSITATAGGLDPTDGEEYRHLFEPMLGRWEKVEPHVLGPLLRLPRHPGALARFGLVGALPATSLLKGFTGARARALIAGCAAHAFLPLNRPLTSAFAILLMVGAHRYGWPFAAGGSQAIVDALASYLRSMGGEIECGRWVKTFGDLPTSRVVLCDLVPSALARMAGESLGKGSRRRMRRFRHGPAAFKLDYALSAPMPWTNPELTEAGTIHLGGTAEDIMRAEAAIWNGRSGPQPFTLVAQPSLFDRSRAPAGGDTLWVYAHVPHGSSEDATEAVERQLDALAPGWKGQVLARKITTPAELESYNPNLVGGDITGGAHTFGQLVLRPFPSRDPYATPLPGVYLCSSSTPPGAGVHGMAGYWAARSALKNELR